MVITVECPSCSASFPVDPNKIPEAGVNARCSSCSHVFRVERPAPEPVADLDALAPEAEAPAPVEEAPAEEAPAEEAPSEPAFAESSEEPAAEAPVGMAEPAPAEPEPEADFAVDAPPADEAEDALAEPAIVDTPDDWVIETEESADPSDVDVAPMEVETGSDATAPSSFFGGAHAADAPAAEAEASDSTDDGLPSFGEAEQAVEDDLPSFSTEPVAEEPVDDLPSFEAEPTGDSAPAESAPADDLPSFGGAAEAEAPAAAAEDDLPSFGEAAAEEPADDLPSFGEVAPAEPEPEPEPAAPAVKGFTFGKRDPKDKAKRLARVLVSDMISYNADRHMNALANGTLKEDFEEEIDKSWKEYVEQVGPEMAEGDGQEFWREALNDVLAKGESVF